ncbi:Protein of unknown function [Pyronema omphalodes CBS 100304]|uniref:Uncharacterized protein n=1 Tax=Pyronema omphalodes (strain CBS 100304) TaxID=1076935 RepID=U4LSJ7_PYROM|nr:Protein of unknown function [Pyronema omphalodes CBS 100304]
MTPLSASRLPGAYGRTKLDGFKPRLQPHDVVQWILTQDDSALHLMCSNRVPRRLSISNQASAAEVRHSGTWKKTKGVHSRNNDW